jgi:CBS domain-containing protein
MLPAFPLDGGRVLRAALAGRLGDLRATRIAAGVGRGAAILLALLAIAWGRLLLLLVSMFLFLGAAAEARGLEIREQLARLRLADLMGGAIVISADTPLSEAAALMRAAGRLEAAVVDRDGRPLGILRAGDLASIPTARRPFVPVSDLRAVVQSRGAFADADEPAADAVERAFGGGADAILVLRDGAVVGIVGRPELERALTWGAVDARAPRPQER